MRKGSQEKGTNLKCEEKIIHVISSLEETRGWDQDTGGKRRWRNKTAFYSEVKRQRQEWTVIDITFRWRGVWIMEFMSLASVF